MSIFLHLIFMFLQGKIYICVSARVGKLFTECLFLNLAFDPRRKNDISGYTWPRSFIQTVKCSLLDEKIVYQSFYGASLSFS